MSEPLDTDHDTPYYLAAAAMYRRFLGWPVFACDTLVWMVPGIVAEAIILPEPDADAVLAQLAEPCPAVELPGAGPYWTLLTRPAHGGRSTERNHMIMLPPTRHPRHPQPLRWRRPPTSPLPEHATVAAFATLPTGARSGEVRAEVDALFGEERLDD